MRAGIAANPNFHFQLDELVSEGDWVTVLTNTPATGAVQRAVCLEAGRVVDGKIAECWNLIMPGSW